MWCGAVGKTDPSMESRAPPGGGGMGSRNGTGAGSKAARDPSPYLDIMTVRNSHLLRDGVDEVRKLILDPVLIPDLEHTGVRPSIDVEDRLLFYPCGSRNCNLQQNVQPHLRDVALPDSATNGSSCHILHVQQPETATSTSADGSRALSKEELHPSHIHASCNTTDATRTTYSTTSTSANDRLHSNTRGGMLANELPRCYKVGKQAPNKVHISSSSSSSHSPYHNWGGGGGVSLPPNKTVAIPREGWYTQDGVKTVRKKPTSDREARHLVHSLRAKAHKMGLLVFDDV